MSTFDTSKYPWFPVKVQRGGPRSLDQCIEEREAWIEWETPNMSLPAGKRKETRSWKRVPTVEDAKTLINDCVSKGYLPDSEHIGVTYFAQGATNVLFLVTCPDWDFETSLLRITMPYDPFYQIESEVACMLKAALSGVPVPQCFLFDSSADNPLGLEWMMIQKFEGPSLEAVYVREIRNGKPRIFDPNSGRGHQVLEEVAAYSRMLAGHEFHHIGSLYFDWDSGHFLMGPIVDDEFLTKYGYRHSEGARGPFNSFEAYLSSLAGVRGAAVVDWIRERQWIRGPDRAGQRQALALKAIVGSLTTRLTTTLEKVYHAETPRGTGPFDGLWAYFQHDDLHIGNIVVRETGGEAIIEGIVDWSGCRIMPHFMRRSQGVPNVNEVFLGENFARADSFNEMLSDKRISDAWRYILRMTFGQRHIVRELMPCDEHVSVATMVLHLWYRQVRKMDPMVQPDLRPVEALDIFVNRFVQSGCE